MSSMGVTGKKTSSGGPGRYRRDRGATAAAAESDIMPRVWAVDAGIPMPTLMACPSGARPG